MLRPAALLGVVVLAGGAAGCTDDEPTTTASGNACSSAVNDAADAAEIPDQIAMLDTALVVCRSYDAFAAELAERPQIIGYDALTFVTRRCLSAGATVRSSTICMSTVTTTASTTPPTEPPISYVGRTLDGRDVTIEPDADTQFIDGTPAAIVQIVDIANEDGCAGVEQEQERWTALADDPLIGDEASVYAQHAINVASFIGC